MDYFKKSNSPDFLKNLLNLRKDVAIVRILDILPFIRRVEAKTMLLKILPVFFSHAEVFRQSVPEAINIIRVLQGHPLFAKERSWFSEWFARLMDANRKAMSRRAGSDGPMARDPNKLVAKNTHTFFIIPGTECVDPIGYAELDFFNCYLRFLKHHKLHKYLYFFSNLSFFEIQKINEANIHMYEDKVNIFPMTTGARRAILRRLGELNSRASRLTAIREMESFSNEEEIEELVEEVKTILRTPIRGCVIYTIEDDLPDLLADVIQKITGEVRNYLTEKNKRILPVVVQLIFLLKRAWSCYFFSKEQKTIFNQLRFDITLMKKNYPTESEKPKIQVQEPKLKNPMEKELIGLDGLISYMEEWLRSREKLEI